MTVNYDRSQINVNEKLNTNKTNIGQLGRKVLGAQTQEQLSDYVSASRINQIRNGDATINQRGESSYSVSGGGYTLDGWFMGANTTYTVTPHTLSTTFKGFNKAIRCQVTGTGNGDPYLLQRIENGHIVFNNQTCTFSFWATGDVETALKSQGVSLPNALVGFDDLVVIDEFRGGWKRYAVTVSFGDLSGLNYLQVGWEFTPNIEFDVYITGIQCEIGSNASPFQHLPIQDQLAWNQRYYVQIVPANNAECWITTAVSYTATAIYGGIRFPVTMRSVPTIVQTTGSGYYQYYRNTTNDLFSSLSVFGSPQSTANSVFVYNNTEVSGTAGEAGNIQAASASTNLAFKSEL